MRLSIAIMLSMLAIPAIAGTTVGQPWLDGQSFGQSMLGSSVGGVTMNNSTTITSIGSSTYNDPNAATNLENDFGPSNVGNVGLASYGNNEVSTCATYTPNPANPAQNNECEAVNFLATNPVHHAVSATGITSSDPMFTNQNNAFNLGLNSTLSVNLGTGTQQASINASTMCTQTTTTTPGAVTQQTCTRNVSATVQGCTTNMGVTMVLAPATAIPPQQISTGIYWDGTNIQISFEPWGWAPAPLYLSGSSNSSGSIALYYYLACCANSTGYASTTYNTANQSITVDLEDPAGGFKSGPLHSRAGYYFYCSGPYWGGCHIFYNGTLVAVLSASGARYPSSGFLSSPTGYYELAYYAYNNVTFQLYGCPTGTIPQGSECMTPVPSIANGCALLQTNSISCTTTSCTCPGGGTWNGILPPGAAACQ